jgi:hypothetical protein
LIDVIKNERKPACNGRFCEIAAVTPQTILCKIARLSPAASEVEAATSQSRWDVVGNRRTACAEIDELSETNLDR